jgi:hypothetical protein
MVGGARVIDTALLPNGAPSFLRVILIHAAYGNNVVAKGAKVYDVRCEGAQERSGSWCSSRMTSAPWRDISGVP